jgi:hypothetical protein
MRTHQITATQLSFEMPNDNEAQTPLQKPPRKSTLNLRQPRPKGLLQASALSPASLSLSHQPSPRTQLTSADSFQCISYVQVA